MAQSDGTSRANVVDIVAAAVDSQIQQGVREIITPNDVTPIPILAEYPLTKYDGLFVLPFEELLALCEKYGIDTKGCRIKYHVVSRIKYVDQQLNLLKDYSFPEIPAASLVDKYRFQLLSYDGAPYMISAVDAFNLIQLNPSLHDVKFPITIGQLIIHDFGLVDSRPGFFTRSCLYPVGYHSQKIYTSLKNPSEVVLYDCWISDSHGKPLFVISLQGAVVSYDYNIDNCWGSLRNRVHDAKLQLNPTRKGLRPVNPVGEEYYGLSNRSVQMYLEKQSTTLQCKGYLFSHQREALGRASEIIRRESVIQKQQEEYNDTRSRTIHYCVEQGRAQLCRSTIEVASNKYRELLRESRIVERLKRDEMRDRERALDKLNEGVLEEIMKKMDASKNPEMMKKVEITAKRVDIPLKRDVLPKNVEVLPKRPEMMLKKVDVMPNRVEAGMRPVEVLPKKPEMLDIEKKEKRKRAATQVDYLQKPSYTIRRVIVRPDMGVATRSRGIVPEVRRIKDEEMIPRSNHRSVREMCSIPYHIGLVRTMVSSKRIPSFSLSLPSIPNSSFTIPDSPPQRFSLLPPTLTGDALALWDCLCFFSPVFQLPRVPYEAFELSLAYPSLSNIFDQQLAILLTLIFTQLRATLLLSDKTLQVPGWKPFVGRVCTVETWPEFARILFICKLWVLSGRDVVSVTRTLMEEGRHSLDDLLIVDPIRGVLSRAAYAARGEECYEATQSLTPTDRLLFTRCLAVLRRLRCSPHAEPFTEPVDCRDFPTYRSIVADPMDLHTLADLLVTGAFCKKDQFDVKAFSETLQRIWDNCRLFSKSMPDLMEAANSMESLAQKFMKTWVMEAKAGERGPWDEAAYFGQGCKYCLLNEEEPGEGECVSCDICEASFHLSCLQPPLCSIPENGWVCGLCRGLSTQERWVDEVSPVDTISTEFDCMIQNVSVCNYGPLHPMAGTGSDSYNYKDLFNPTILNPVFFGTLPRTDERESWSVLSPSARFRRLAILLSSEHPCEMTVVQRLAIAQSIVEIARDVPEVIRFVGMSESAIERVYAEKDEMDHDYAALIRELCAKMNNSMKKKKGNDEGEEKDGTGNAEVESTKETEESKSTKEVESEKNGETEKGMEVESEKNGETETGENGETEKGMEVESEKNGETEAGKNGEAESTHSMETGSKEVDSVTPPEPNFFQDTEIKIDDVPYRPSRIRGWTEEEVEVLRQAVKKIGEGKWTKIVSLYGEKLGNRSAPGKNHDSC